VPKRAGPSSSPSADAQARQRVGNWGRFGAPFISVKLATLLRETRASGEIRCKA
jgi:hypothetical protein